MKTGGRAGYLVMPLSSGPMDGLVAAAKAEGQLNVIALPRKYCGYGGIINRFKAKYGVTINEFLPQASSSSEINAIRNARDKTYPQAPDVIDIGLSFAPSPARDGLLQPYKVSTWATIPDRAKDAAGYWYGAYYGRVVFEINADLITKIPLDWADLTAPEYRGAVGLAGDIASNQAIQAILASGLSAANGDVSEAADQGLRFFADLNQTGNFVPIIGNRDSLIDGRTPILIRWDYLALGDRDALMGKTRIEIVRPKTGVVAGVYAQAISAFAPHPNAARLWMEYLYSDETQFAWLNGHCYPIRLPDLVRNGKVSDDMRTRLAQFKDYGDNLDPYFPTPEEQEKARETIMKGWDSIVGVTVRCYPNESPSNVPMVFNDSAILQHHIPL
ncbi:ABC transporter substrate-binding protein [Rhizobium sp. KVB221]|uniref:ABC transporter substrate-binding protein n=1 Tax=Rhizobium setariae TaxID=2801340 RepID=A0A936YPR8_9HYPH|nr:ABC transporter substrate-binding protein [Rhizobium setariae]MBL0374455.1 ABC transporter substrate-binding protein [Rhizobium setariae]